MVADHAKRGGNQKHCRCHEDNPQKRFINDEKKINDDKLIFLKVISNVVKSGMDIVGVNVPEKM